MTNKVQAQELIDVLRSALGSASGMGLEDFELEEDYFWETDFLDASDTSEEPSDFSIGQYSDDLAELRRVLSRDRQPCSYDLVRLSNILRYVGMKNAF